MMKEPLVSVIVPNYNYAQFLPQRMETVLNQTYQNIEVIILDDCSTDCSGEVIETYRNHPKVSCIVYNKENSGSPFRQWHKGINLAKGDLIWIAESDDYAESDFLGIMVKQHVEHTDVSFVYSDLVFVNKNGQKIVEANMNHCHNRPATRQIYSGAEFIRERMIDMCCVCNASSVLFSREKALTIDGSYTEFKAAGDYFFWILMAEKGNVVKIDKVLDYVRLHNTNVTPISYKNGTTYRELNVIFRYIVKKKYLLKKEAFRQYLYKIEQIKRDDQLESQVKKQVLRVWDPFSFFNKYTMALCWHLFS